jgi:hypothetical protein
MSTIASTAPDLVEVDLVDGHAMRRGLDLTEQSERAPAAVAHGRVELGGREHGVDLAPSATVLVVLVLVLVEMDGDAGGAEAAPYDVVDGDRPAVDRERGQSGTHLVRVGTEADERPEQHVTRRAEARVEPQHGHRRLISSIRCPA